MQYLLDKYGIELYNIYPFSLEDRVRELVGEVCFYNGSGRKGGSSMKREKKEGNTFDHYFEAAEKTAKKINWDKILKNKYFLFRSGKRHTTVFNYPF